MDYVYLSGYYADFSGFSQEAVSIFANAWSLENDVIDAEDALDAIGDAIESVVDVPVGGWPMEEELGSSGEHTDPNARLRWPALTWTAWIIGWLVLSVSMTGLGAGYSPLLQSAGFGILASGGAVLAAVLIVPWQEHPVRNWSWGRGVTWLGRAAFGVFIASILLPILYEFFSILSGTS